MVSIKLADVPWDQALDLILKTNVPQLARSASRRTSSGSRRSDKLIDEEQRRRRVDEDRKKTIEAQRALEPLFSKTFAISYIEATNMARFVAKLEKFKSVPGDHPVRRTHQEHHRLGHGAETRRARAGDHSRGTRQRRRFSSRPGSSTSRKVSASPLASSGTRTPSRTPPTATRPPTRSRTRSGRRPADRRAQGRRLADQLPGQPTRAAATGGIGFSLGHIANTLALDMRLSAGENMSKVKILSNPKVLVIQNERAVINLGSELPVPKTDSEGNKTVEWKEVGITLDVMPQITNDKLIFMDIKIEQSAQGVNVQTTEGRCSRSTRAGPRRKS